MIAQRCRLLRSRKAAAIKTKDVTSAASFSCSAGEIVRCVLGRPSLPNQRLGPSNLLSVLLILPLGLNTVPPRLFNLSLAMPELRWLLPAKARLNVSWYALPLPLPRGVHRFLVPECDLSLPPLPCCARCLVRGLDTAMLDEEKRRAGVRRGRGAVSLEVDAAAEGVRSAPKAGLAKPARSRDVDAKTMVMLCER